MNVTQLCRNNLYQRLGIDEVSNRNSRDVWSEIKRITDSLDSLVLLARPRLVMGGIRYGSKWEHKGLMDYMQNKFSGYVKTGNFELLVDLFNFCAIEGALKTHPNFHFMAEDRE